MPPSTPRTPTRVAAARAARALTRAASMVVTERLEPRRLFAATVVSPIPATAGAPGGTATTVDVAPFFADDANAYVRFTTPVGDFRVRLFEAQKPVTVQNFLKYVTQGRYDGTVIHRVDTLAGDNSASPITTEPDIVQGGGFRFPGFEHIRTDAPIPNEFDTNGVIGNNRGTIAMAKTSDPNSATSEWFVNTVDNRTALDDPANSGGFTVFGEVLDMPVVDAIGDIPRFEFGGAFGKIPLRDFTAADLAAEKMPTDANVVSVSAAVIPDLMSYAATSSDPSLVNPSVDANGKLSLSYGTGRGTATITVTATPPDGGAPVSTSFTAGVGQVDVRVGGDSGIKSLTFREDDGTVGTVSIKGPGSAAVRLTGADLTQTAARGRLTVGGTGVGLALVTLTGTTAGTTVTIGGKGGDRVLALGGLSADAPVKSIAAKAAALTGSLTTSGRVGSLALGSTTGATITLGGVTSDPGSSVTIGAMADTDLVSGAPVRSLKVASTANTDGESDVIAVTGNLDSLNVAGDLASDVTVSGGGNIRSAKVGGDLTGDLTAHQILSLAVRGDVAGAELAATHEANEHASAAEANRKQNQGIGSMKVSGTVTDSTVRSAGSIGSLSAASLVNSRVFAGPANASVVALPAVAADLSQETTLLAMKVGSFANSTVSAKYLGKLSVGTIANVNDGIQLGFATTRITSLTGTLADGGRIALKNVQTAAEAEAALAGLTLGDLVVRVL